MLDLLEKIGSDYKLTHFCFNQIIQVWDGYFLGRIIKFLSHFAMSNYKYIPIIISLSHGFIVRLSIGFKISLFLSHEQNPTSTPLPMSYLLHHASSTSLTSRRSYMATMCQPQLLIPWNPIQPCPWETPQYLILL